MTIHVLQFNYTEHSYDKKQRIHDCLAADIGRPQRAILQPACQSFHHADGTILMMQLRIIRNGLLTERHVSVAVNILSCGHA
jgi:hypothetical protein